MKQRSSSLLKRGFRNAGRRAFSLIEVVIALGICVFALFPMMSLLTSGLRLDQDSRQQMQAADLATLLVAERRESPTSDQTNSISHNIWRLPLLNMPYPATAPWVFMNFAGATNFPNPQSQPTFRVSYQVGTSTANPNVGLIHLLFTWPPGADPATAPGRYEMSTQVFMPQ